MNIWPAVRDEVQGAWRSMRYDLARRPGRGEPGPGRPVERQVPHDYDPYEGGPRRIIVTSGMAALIVGGAVGSYFGVVNGLGALLDRPPTPAALPTVSGESDVTAMGTPGAAAADRRRAGQGLADSGAATTDGAAPRASAGVSTGISAGRAVGRATPPAPTLETTPDAEDPTPWPDVADPGYPTDPAYPPFPTDPADPGWDPDGGPDGDPSADPDDPTPHAPWPTDSGEPFPPADRESAGGSGGAGADRTPSWEPTGWENRGRWDGAGGRWAKAESGGTWTSDDGTSDCRR